MSLENLPPFPPVLRRSKILATLGPASTSPEMLRALVEAGVDAFRVNASHLTPEEVAVTVSETRAVLKAFGRPVPVLVDVQGPKLRLERMAEPLEINPGVCVRAAWAGAPAPAFSSESSESSQAAVQFAFDPFEVGLEVGQRVLFADGRVQAVVSAADRSSGLLELCFPSGGVLESRKGVNLPDTLVQLPVLSDEDRRVVEAGLEAGCEWFALSFVQTPEDVLSLREIVGDRAWIMSKVERPQALVDLPGIVEASDGMLVARGDLGVELPFEEVPLVQREVWLNSRQGGKPVVCATEMLESMISSSRPTRAETTDVSSAVFDAFDALMLSAESAVGHDPVGAVQAMHRIRQAVESSSRFTERLSRLTPFQDTHPTRAAVAAAAVRLARDTDADAVVALTASGFTARLLSACRPTCPVVAVTPSSHVAAAMNLLWGITPLVAPRAETVEFAARDACDAAVKAGLVKRGAKVVVCGSRLGPTSDADAIWVQIA